MSSAPKNDLLLRAARGEATERVPIWLMRQAGRVLHEYRALRERYAFLDLVHTPEAALEASLQPYRAFAPDAVIMFSDILTPLAGMGLPFTIDDGGPRVLARVGSRAEAERLRVADPSESVPYVLELLRLLRREVGDEVPVLGFAGAPYTLATYVTGGGSGSAREGAAKALAYHDPDAFHLLLGRLADQTALYLAAQVEAGAHCVQLFDTWAGELSAHDYRALALPYQQRALVRVLGQVPVILYVLGGSAYPNLLAASGADVVSVDWRLPLDRARASLPGKALQGNLDPAVLLGPPELVQARTREVLAEGGGHGHIFNLGHGLWPTSPRENVALLFETVRAWRPGPPAA